MIGPILCFERFTLRRWPTRGERRHIMSAPAPKFVNFEHGAIKDS